MKFLLIACSMILTLSAFAQSKETTKLLEAVENNNIKQATKAIKNGADVNARTTTTTVLVRAVKLSELNMVKLLLDNHADINQTRPIDLYSPLMLAAKLNNMAIAQLLISRGADVSLYTVSMRNALHIAALNNSIEVAKLLVSETNIDVNAREELCALAVAARQDHREIVSLLKNLDGQRAPTQKCLERAIDMADFNDHEEVLKILRG